MGRQDESHPLPGSERPQIKGSTLLGRVEAHEQITVAVILSDRSRVVRRRSASSIGKILHQTGESTFARRVLRAARGRERRGRPGSGVSERAGAAASLSSTRDDGALWRKARRSR